MIPAFLIPIVVQVLSRGVKYAFDSLEKKPESKKEHTKQKLKDLVSSEKPTKGANEYVNHW